MMAGRGARSVTLYVCVRMRVEIGLLDLSTGTRRTELFVDDLDRRMMRGGWRTILADAVEGRRRRRRRLEAEPHAGDTRLRQ